MHQISYYNMIPHDTASVIILWIYLLILNKVFTLENLRNQHQQVK